MEKTWTPWKILGWEGSSRAETATAAKSPVLGRRYGYGISRSIADKEPQDDVWAACMSIHPGTLPPSRPDLLIVAALNLR